MYVRLLTNNFLSEKAVGKSESKDVHLAVLRVLPEVIRESVDADASSKSVIIYDPATGEKKMVSPTAVDGIESLGEVKTAEQTEAEINARMQDTIQRSKDWLEGNVANPVGMQIQLGDGRIATIEAMHEDGKSAIATLPDGTQFLVPNDVLQRIVNNGQYADYKARRDAEAGKREAEQDTESAPETATEGGQPLPEEASTKEEESREYAQGDVFDVVVDGQKMHAEIVSPKDADGRFVVNVDDGESMRTLYVTPEELAAMEYREEPSPKAEETRLATDDSSDKALERGAQPTEEHTPTALERIPRDEKGNAQFHDVDTETAWDGLVEMSGNEETAHKVAEASLANAEKRLKAAKALKEKGETPEELLRSIKENEKAVAEAEKEVAAWKAIVGEKSRREEAAKAEAERIATEKAEAERKAAEERERAEAEEKARIEAEKKETERIAAEKAEEEARVEAERKAEEERIAKQKAEEKVGSPKIDKQGNPIDAEGRLITEKVEDISDLSDDDFNNPKRSVELPKIPKNIDNALGANGKPVIIKKNIFERNKNAHSDLTAEQSREILKTALYSADLYAKNQKSKRPFNWVIIKTKDHDGKNKLVLLEVNDNKDNVEIVHWHYLDDRGLEKIKKQAEREGGQLLILPSEKEEAGALSSRTSDLPADKGSEKPEKKQEKEQGKKDVVDVDNPQSWVGHTFTGIRGLFKGQQFVCEGLDGDKAVFHLKTAADDFKFSITKMRDMFARGWLRVENADLKRGNESVFDIAAAIAKKEEKEAAERQERMDGYTADMPPMRKARVRKTLGKELNYRNFGVMTEGEFVESMVAAGGIVTADFHNGKMRWLIDPNDGELGHLKYPVSKAAADYAVYLGAKVNESELVNAKTEARMHEIRRKYADEDERGMFDNEEWLDREIGNSSRDKRKQERYEDLTEYKKLKEERDAKFNAHLRKLEKKQEKESVFDKAKEIADKEEKKRKAEAEDDSVLGQAARAVGKKKKVNLFKYTASQKDAGEVIKGVHYANGYAYASDGYILFKEKADYPKEWEGTTRDKDGNLIDGKYPDAEKAIHRLVHIPDKEVESLPSKGVLDFAIAASKKLKGEAIPVAIDGIFFNAVNLKKFLEAVASKGMDKVVYRHPMLYATNGKDEIVMMPTVNTLEGALDIADKMESAGLPKEQIDAWKAHIEAADKEMSFEDFKKAVENAKKKGDKAESPKQKELTEAERKDAEEVAGALGYRVEWVDTMEENGTIDADKKVIRIAKDAENPLVQVLGHEVAHGVRRMIGGKFRALQKAAMEVVGEKEWNERIEKKRKLNAYAEGKLAEEVTCDIVGEALNDKDALKRLAESLRGEKGILARLRDAVARMVEYFKNRGDKEGVRRMKAADKLLAEFESALKEGVAPEQVKPEGIERSVRESRSEKTELTAEERELRDNLVERMRKGGLDVVTDSEEMQRVIDTENERTRNMFVGEKGATEADKAEEVSTRLDNLSVARRMEKAKKDAKTIKMATGWERGSDGKWRYETGDAKIKDTIELDGKTFKRYEEDMLWTSGKFGDVVDAPELFKAYPELRDVRIETDAVLNDMPSNGEYNPRTNTITIHSDDLKYQNSILNHEIQHAIQHIEGFETGGSAENVRERIQQVIDNSSDEVGYARERLREWADLNAMAAMLDVAYRKFVGSGNEWERAKAVEIYWDAINTIEDNDKAELAINYPHDKTPREVAESGYLVDDVIRELNRLADETRKEIPDGDIDTMRKVDRLVGALKDKTDFELYNRLAGEVEARNTEKRIGMTEEERRASLASETEDVAREDQILLGVDNADGEMNTGSVREHRVYHGSGADFDAFDHSHMGEGEGAQAYGWGTYVTEVEGIGRTYAIQNTTKHNDALRALQHDVDAISDQLNRQRDDLKYDEEQLKRANEWRAEAELDYELFKDEAEELKEKYGEASPKYRNHLFNDIYTDEMKRAQSSVKSTEESIQYRKEKIAELEKALKDKHAEIDELPKEFPRHLYTVEIPDDNGSNYLDWNGHPAESLLKGVGSFLESNGFERVQDNPVRYEKGESTVVLNPNATGADLYAELRETLGSDKKASQALAELGCIGIKYPADNMRGGRKDGAKNYVIFNENDAKITDHTRFLRTADGEVYGLVKDGRIYLDPKVATAETAVHEYTHLWGDMLRRKDSEQWNHTVKELKNSVLWEEVKESYPELKTDDEIADEVLSTFSGRRGAERLREEARRVADGEGGVFTKAKAMAALENVKNAIARFWEGVARMFGINRYRSVEELADMAMRDLLDSKNPMKDESGMRKRGEVGETLATSGTYFSGGGLLEAGLKGVIDPKVAVEFSEKIAGVYADNHGNHIVVADVRDVDPKKLVGAVDGGEVQYFHASPVCKNFSKAKREGGEVELDKETALSTAEFIAKTRPKVVTIENVKGYRNSEALKIITDELTRQGYDWDADVYNTADYGGYTKRERLIVRAKRDGKLPPKPEKFPEELRKKGWYSAVEDLIPHLEEKKTGVPQGTDERLKNSGIDYRTIDKPLYVFGRGYANKTVGHAFADELLPTLTTGGGDIIIMPDGRVLKASPRVLARVTGLPDTYKMPETDQLSHTIVGNGIPTQLTEGVIAPLLDNAIPSAERATKRESVFDVADRVSQNLEERTRAMAERIAEQPVEEINNRFNEELEKYQNNELPKGHRFELGMPSAELQSAGFPTLPISMRSSLLAKKAGAERHPFAPTDLRDLVNAIQKPIAIFNYSKNNMRNLIVDVSRGGKHFLVGVTLNYKADNIEINSVSGLFPKENHEWIKWIQDGKVLRIDQKEKVQDLINSLRTNPAESERIGLNLDDVAKKVKDFENPKLFDGKISEVDKKGSDSIERSVRENPKNEDKPRFSRKPGESIFDYASRVSEDVDRSVRERVSARDEYEKKVKSKGFQTKEALQNSMLGLQEFMSAIDHASGNRRYIEDIPDFENPILGENRLSSVNKEEMHQVAKTQFKPLMSAVAKLSGNGKESGELYDYMFAKHGLERDAVMRQREAQKEFDKYQKANPKGTKTIGDFVASLEGKDYAGLTALTAEDGRVKSIQSQIDAIDEQMKATDDQLLLRKLGGQKKRLKVDLLNAARDAADDIRKAFESDPSHDRSDINELWSRVNEVNGNTLRKLYESGMLTKEAYNDISSMYTNYIPMRGFDQTTSADAYAYLTHGDSAFNAPIKTAKGRSSKADNPIAYMQAMAESAIMQGNRNVLVKQKMLNFVRNHPSDLASVSDVWLQYDSVADEWKPFYGFGRESKG